MTQQVVSHLLWGSILASKEKLLFTYLATYICTKIIEMSVVLPGLV